MRFFIRIKATLFFLFVIAGAVMMTQPAPADLIHHWDFDGGAIPAVDDGTVAGADLTEYARNAGSPIAFPSQVTDGVGVARNTAVSFTGTAASVNWSVLRYNSAVGTL